MLRPSDRSGSGAGGDSGISSAGDPDSLSRWRDRWYFGRRLENALREPWNNNNSNDGTHDGSPASGKSSREGGQQSQNNQGSSSNPVNLNQSSPIWLSDEMEYWPDGPRSLKFVSIADMHRELVALGANRALYQWKCVQVEPYKHPELLEIQFKN